VTRHARFLLLPIALVIVLAAPAIADPRIATHFYQASDVVVLHGHAGIQSTIAFAPDERIENIAVGDSAAWQVTPNKRADLLFVKPANADARTNMTVVTDQRTYLFDLVSSARAPAIYMLRFTYPASPKPAAPIVAAADVTTPTPSPKPAEPDPATLNFAWTRHGDKQLLPSRSFDDGHSTYLAWPHDVALPAILLREPTGAEGPVNYTVHGDYIVVEGVPSQLILRSGKQMATLTAAPRAAQPEAAPSLTPPTSTTAAGKAAEMAYPDPKAARLPSATVASSQP
jgi:type IV secretion system protein VirB9